MSTPPFRIVHADWVRDGAALCAVRETVFVHEQHVPVELEWDGLDEQCHHVLALNTKGHPVGTGRLAPDHGIGRMAVLRPWRGRGVGSAMLRALIECAHAHHWAQVTVHAQVDAIDFYRYFGFVPDGGEFIEAGILHQLMYLDLASPTQREAAF